MQIKELRIHQCLFSLGVSSCSIAIIIWIISLPSMSDYSLIQKAVAGLAGYIGYALGLFITSCAAFFVARALTKENITCLYIALFASSGLAIISWQVVLSQTHMSSVVINIGSGIICLVGYFAILGSAKFLLGSAGKHSDPHPRK